MDYKLSKLYIFQTEIFISLFILINFKNRFMSPSKSTTQNFIQVCRLKSTQLGQLQYISIAGVNKNITLYINQQNLSEQFASNINYPLLNCICFLMLMKKKQPSKSQSKSKKIIFSDNKSFKTSIQSSQVKQIQIINLNQKMTQRAKLILQKCCDQNNIFQKWAIQKSWRSFHSAHYDWWAFPIDEPSSYGFSYAVNLQVKQQLIKKPQFINALKSNAKLVCLSWGWNIQSGKSIQKPQHDQRWQNWPIRLYKMTKSLLIFEEKEYYTGAWKLGNSLTLKGAHFKYGNRDMNKFFQKLQDKFEFNNIEQKTTKKNDYLKQ